MILVILLQIFIIFTIEVVFILFYLLYVIIYKVKIGIILYFTVYTSQRSKQYYLLIDG